ncbi:MAG: DNA replication protein [Alphaproteobacteria bacterium]|nr:DNA replication protein [Alphaproteobacteria bacterium]
MSARAHQIPMSFPHSASMAREDFLVSECNRDALAWIDRWPYWNAPALYIYGPEGSGKSHLANIWAATVGAKGQVVDGLDTILGNRPEEEALFHLYNRVRQTPGSLLITGTKPLALCRFEIPDLASRLKSCPQVALGLPDEDLLRMLLVKLFSDRQMRIDAGVIEYCVARMERSFAAARDVVDSLDKMSMVEKRPVTTGMARAVLNPAQTAFGF